MKASEFIERIEVLKKEFGDVDILIEYEYGICVSDTIGIYYENGEIIINADGLKND